MNSRAYILLKTEVEELKNRRNEGISAVPLTKDLMKWRAQIEGHPDSIWKGFVLDLAIDFTPEYNLVPPAVKFLTIPFHPNVDPYTGQPNVDFLDSPDYWNTNYTLSGILLALQAMLSNPVLENPVNLEAAQLLMRNESLYRTVIQKLFQPAPQMSKCSPESPKQPQEHVKVTKTISFNDYYKTWSEIATSKTAEHSKNPFVGDRDFMQRYNRLKRQDLQHHKQWKLKFGVTKCRFAREKKSPASSSNHFIQRKIAAPSPTEVSYDSVESEPSKVPQEGTNDNWPVETESGDSWEEEVDKIVAWTNRLDVDTLDYEN